MNIALKLFLLLLFSILLGLGAGYVVMDVLPEHWFGSNNFAGASGYRALWIAIMVGLVVLTLSYGILSYHTVRSLPVPSNSTEDALPKSLLWTWISSLVLYLVSPLFIFLGFGSLVDTSASALTIAFFLSTSVVVARRKGKNPLLAFVALVPIVGVITVAVLLFVKRRQPWEEAFDTKANRWTLLTKIKPTARTMLTYALLGPPIGAVMSFLIYMTTASINSELSQFGSSREQPVEMLKLLYLSLIFSFPLGLVPALLSGCTQLILQNRFHLQRAAIVCAVTSVGLVSTILQTLFFGNLEMVLESANGILMLILPPLAASFAISIYLTCRIHNEA